jgi:hypothetical protein
MFRYNNTRDSDSGDSGDSGDNDIEDTDSSSSNQFNNEILMELSSNRRDRDITSPQYNMIDTIVQHPFMERLKLREDDLHNCREKIYIIPYKTTKHSNEIKTEYFTEYHIPGEILSTTTIPNSNCLDTLVDDKLTNLSGRKKLMGNTKFNGHQYLFVQVRDNDGFGEHWITKWDILANRHHFGEKIQQIVIDFFIHHSTVSDLILHKQICSKPISLYTMVDETYLYFIIKNQSIQYCQRDKGPLITLNKFTETDNIKAICFVEDCVFSTNNRDLIDMGSIQIKENNKASWIFKNENEIVSYSTKK